MEQSRTRIFWYSVAGLKETIGLAAFNNNGYFDRTSLHKFALHVAVSKQTNKLNPSFSIINLDMVCPTSGLLTVFAIRSLLFLHH